MRRFHVSACMPTVPSSPNNDNGAPAMPATYEAGLQELERLVAAL
jgi:hypothetical protein